MTKERYIKLVKDYIAWNHVEDNIYMASGKVIQLWDNEELDVVMSNYLDLIAEASGDKNNNYGSLLSYFIFELDTGKYWEPGSVVDSEGNDIVLDSVEHLADYLFKDKQEG